MSQTDSRELRNYLAVNLVRGLGPRLQTVLLERFGSPAGILQASPEELSSTPGIGRKSSRNCDCIIMPTWPVVNSRNADSSTSRPSPLPTKTIQWHCGRSPIPR